MENMKKSDDSVSLKEVLDNHWFQFVQLVIECSEIKFSFHEEGPALWWELVMNNHLWAGSNAGKVIDDAWNWIFKEGPNGPCKPRTY